MKVVKGDVKEKTIALIEPAGLVRASDGSEYIMSSENYTPLQKNTKYLFFLASTDALSKKYADIYERNGYKEEFPGKYIMLSAGFSKHNLDKSDKVEQSKLETVPELKAFRDKVLKKYKSEFDTVTESENN